MPKQSETSVPIMEGTALLVRIPTSPTWHVKYKAAGKWLRTSTKKKELDAAKKAAAEIVVEARVKEKNNIPVVNQSFRAVANAAIKRMENELASGHGKTIYKDYIYVLKRYFIPYFASTYIRNIDYAALDKFDKWRFEQNTKQLSHSTIANHNAALHRVFDEAVMLRYMTASQVPVLQNRGAKGVARPAFNLVDYRKLFRSMRKWVRQPTRKKQSGEIRYLLRDMVLILCNTGMRVGTECDNLKWQHITHFREHGREYLEIAVKGKTGSRKLMARYGCKRYLTRIYQRDPELQKYKTVEDLLDARVDKHVFRLSDGSAPARLDQAFTRMLKDFSLLVDPETGAPRTLYSCRHTYATLQLQGGTDIHVLEVAPLF